MFCRIDYFSARVDDEPGAASRLLAGLAAQRVDLIAVVVAPGGPRAVTVHLFPVDPVDLSKAARAERIALDGPRSAIFAQAEDRVGAFAAVLETLASAGVGPPMAFSMRDGRGRFGCVVPVDSARVDAALRALRFHTPLESTEPGRLGERLVAGMGPGERIIGG